MKKCKAKSIFRIFLVLVLVAGSAEVFLDIFVGSLTVDAASGPIIINQDSEYEFKVPEDSNTKTESQLPAGYIQSASTKLSLIKDKIQALSYPVYNTIEKSYLMNDGNYLHILTIDNNLAKDIPYGIATTLIVKTDKDGNVLQSRSIPSGNYGTSITTDRTSGGANEFSRYFASKQNDDHSIWVYFSGQIPDDYNNTNRAVLIDTDLNINYYTVSNGQYTPKQRIEGFLTILNSDEVFNTGYFHGGVENRDTFEFYTVGSNGEYTNARYMDFPYIYDYFPGGPNDGYQLYAINDTYLMGNSQNLAGVVAAYNPPYDLGYAIVLWNQYGTILNQYTLNYLNVPPILQKFLSDGDNYYFVENDSVNQKAYLKRMDMTDGNISEITEFPYGTKIQIVPQEDSEFGANYTFYGSITDASGPFFGYAPEGTGGAVSGTMDQDFNVTNASVVVANGTITQNDNIILSDTGRMVSGSTAATDFAETPPNGWENQGVLSDGKYGNAYFGSMSLVKDHSPGLNVGNPITINKDTVANWDTALLNGVSATDIFDLNPKMGNRGQTWLDNRINRNPYKTDLAYEWERLGLDKNKVGPNQVTYFVTDSSMQTTADSKTVNVVAESTSYDSGETVALDARNFTIPLAEAKTFTKEKSLDANHGNVTAWDMISGNNLLGQVVANPGELQAITQATAAGVYPLTYTVTLGEVTVTKKVTVFVTDDKTVIDQDNDVVLFAKDFTLQLAEAAAFSSAEAVSRAAAKAYSFSSGNQLPDANLSAGVAGIQSATAAGPKSVAITYRGTEETATSVIASILNRDTDIDPAATTALYAKNFTIGLGETSGLTGAQAKTAAAVFAWDMSDGTDVTGLAEVDAEQLQAIVDAEAAGVFPLTFSVPERDGGSAVVNTISVFVTDDNTVINDDVILFANDFVMQLADAAMATSEGLKNLSDARAYRISTAEQLPDENIAADTSAVNRATTVGPVNVSVSYTDGSVTLTTVVASLIDEHTVLADEEAIYATGFKVALNDVAALDDDAIQALGHAKAWNVKDGSSVSVLVDSAIQAAVGPYRVAFSTANDTSTSVIASVFDDNTVLDDDKNEAVYATHFMIDIADVDALTEAKVKTLAGAKAWNMIDGSDLALSANFSAIQKAAGVYDVSFSTANGTVRTVKATVKDEHTVINDDEALVAKNFVISVDEAKVLDKAAADVKAGAKAWKLTDGTPVSFTTDLSAVKAVPGAYKVVLTTEAGTTKTIYATVYDDDTVIDEEKGEAVYAHDFVIDKGDVATLTKQIVDTKAGAKAWKLADGSALTFTTDFSAVQPEIGAYSVSFTTANKVEKKIIVSVIDDDTVIDDTNKEAIHASNFTITAAEVGDLTKLLVDTKAGAKAWDTHTGNPVTFTTDFAAVQAEAGAYPVVFKTVAGTTRTIIVSVTDDDTIIDPDNDEALRAKNFIVQASEVSALNKAKVDAKAGAKAWKLSDGTAVLFTTDFAAIQTAIGAYPVNFATSAGNAKAVMASVVDEDTRYDIDHTAALYARNFSVSLSDVTSLSEALVKDSSHAAVKAWNMNSGADATAKITVNATELQAIRSATDAKPYNLTFEVVEDGATVSKTITVFVTDDRTIVDPVKNIVLYANSFTMQLADAANATSEQATTLAAAKAYNFKTGALLPATNLSADVTAINAATAVGPVNTTITYNDGNIVSTIVVASLIDEDTAVDPAKDTALYAHSFVVESSEVDGLTKAKVDGKAGAKAWKLSDASVLSFNTDFAAITKVAGPYPVSFTTENGLNKTVTATVADVDTVVEPDKNTALYAKSFTMDKSEVAGLTKAIVDSKAGAKAWQLSNGDSLTFTTDFTAIQAVAGAYPVTFRTTDGVSKTVYATVTDEDTIIDPTVDTALYAHSFQITKDEVADLNDEMVNTLAGAKAWKLNDASALSFSTDFTAIQAVAGAYPVVFTTETGVSKTVYATVTDGDTIVDPTKDIAIYAHNFTIHVSEAQTIDEAGFISRAEAKAWRLSDGIAVPLTVDSKQFAAKVGVYPATFVTGAGVSRTIFASVINDDTVVSDKEVLHAHGFTIDKSEVAALDAEKIMLLAEAKAWKLADGAAVNFATDASAVIEEAGTYPVVFTTEAGTSKTIYVTVTDDNTVIVDDEALHARSFTMDISEVATATEASIIEKAAARAWRISDQAMLEVKADFSAIVAKAGAYPVVFTTEGGTTRTVYASVLDDKTVVTGDVAVRADNFDLLVSEVAGLSDAQVRERAGFQAWLISGGQDVSDKFVVDYSRIKAAVGSYPVTFASAEVQAYSGELLSRTVIANVQADPVDPELPMTGSNELEAAIIGVLGVIAGAVLIIRRRNK